jgi:hypothetical protein
VHDVAAETIATEANMRTILTLVLGLAISGAVGATGLGAGLKPSTPGIGLEISSSALEMFGPRIWSAVLRDDAEEAVIRYEAAPRVGTGLLLADWHLGGTGFRVSGGLAYNQQRADAFGRTGGLIGIGGRDPTTMLGTFDGRMRYAKPSPYLGLGWGIAPSRKSGLYFSADVGLLYQRPNAVPLSGCPALSSACGMLSADGRDESEIRSVVEDFRFFPVVTFGVGLRF